MRKTELPASMNGHVVDVLAVTRSPELRSTVAAALAELGHARLRTVTNGVRQTSSVAIAARPPDLLLLDVDLEDASEMASLEELVRAHAEQTAVAVTTSNPSLDGMRRLMRLGVLDVVPQPIQGHDLRGAVERAAERVRRHRASDQRRDGVVVAFMRSCGGAGATTLAVQSACGLGNAKAGESSVCLIDLDIQFGDVALHLDLEPGDALLELLNAGDRLDGAMVRGAMMRHSCGIDVLTAPAALTPLDVIAPDAVQRLLIAAREEYSHVILDMPRAWTSWTRAALECADHIALLVHMTVPALRHGRRQIEILAEEGLDHVPLSIVANRVAGGFLKKGLKRRDAEKALQRPIDLVLLENARPLREAADGGQPLTEVRGGRRTMKEIRRFIAGLRTKPLAGATA